MRFYRETAEHGCNRSGTDGVCTGMGPLDVRDVGGRAWRLFWSVLAGAQVAVLIAVLLPQKSMRGWGGGAFGAANSVLVAAGALGITLAVYAVLNAFARRPPRMRIRVPRAVVLRGR
jgi:hypothetical protein